MASLRALGPAGLLLLMTACATPPAPGPTPPAAASPAAMTPVTITAPGPTPAKAGPVPFVNAGFESLVPGRRGDPEGWFTFQHAGDKSYHFVLDTAQPHGGERSLRIDNVGPEPYGAVAQSIVAAGYGGKVARFTAWMRTRDVSETGAVLTLLVLSNGAVVDQNFMSDKPVKGTTGWTRYTITLPVPRGAERVEAGAMLQGKGSLWLDDTTLEFVDP